MPFDDLTSERARQLLQALLLEMDPDRYASFMALGTFEGWEILVVRVGQLPDKGLDGWKGRFESADLLGLRDVGMMRELLAPTRKARGRLQRGDVKWIRST